MFILRLFGSFCSCYDTRIVVIYLSICGYFYRVFCLTILYYNYVVFAEFLLFCYELCFTILCVSRFHVKVH